MCAVERQMSMQECAIGGSAGFQTCCVAGFQAGRASRLDWPAGLETRDTADLEVCATVAVPGRTPIRIASTSPLP
jgi:hypothetical protein